MTLEGFCLAHQADIPLPSGRWCAEHATIVLPPSWSDQHAVYPAWPPRPDGYVWVARQLQAPTRKPQAPKKQKPFTPAPPRQKLPARQTTRATYDLTCRQCGTTVQVARQGGPARAYCSTLCHSRAAIERKRVGISTETIRCQQCGTETPAYGARGSLRRRYCSGACRREWNRAHDPRSKSAREVAA